MTHKQAILRLLSDGKPHTHRELYALGCVAHSRVADLRRDGWLIEKTGPKDGLYLYQLKGMLGGTSASPDLVRDRTDGLSEAPPSTSSNPTGGRSAPLSPAISSREPHPHTRDGDVLELFECVIDESAGLRDTYWEPDAA